MVGRRVREHFGSYGKEAYVDEARFSVQTDSGHRWRVRFAPHGFALRRARCRRRWRRAVSLVPSAPVGYTARSSPSSLPVSPAQAYFTALLTERTGVPAWSDAPIDGARALLLHLRRGRLAALGSS